MSNPLGVDRIRRIVALALVGTAVVLPAGAAVSPPDPTAPEWDAGPLTPTGSRWLSDRLLELTFRNPRLDPPLEETRVRVLVPRDWRDSGERYPVIYLLHGAGDDASAWTEKQDGYPVTLEEFTEGNDVIVVMPDGGGAGSPPGWYSDWYNEGEFGPPEWETYHVAQLVRLIDQSFPTRAERRGRIVAGLSMGGFGAMSYAARHPHLFAGAFSFSGALDTNTVPIGESNDDIWGPKATEEVRTRGRNPTDLVANLRHTRVWFRTGMGIPGGPAPLDNHPAGVGIEVAVWATNESFERAARAAGVPYTYRRYEQGAHNWWHWHRGFALAWPEMEEVFATDTGRPARFDYRSTEPRFRAWGWRVRAIRDVVEFLRMENVRDRALRLVGSGAVRLVTPARFEPGRLYQIEVIRGDRTDSRSVAAGEAGRLRFRVRLGPSHQFQQYTAQWRAAAAADPGYWHHARVRIRPVPRGEVVLVATGSASVGVGARRR